MSRIFAIADIHGRRDLLDALLSKLNLDLTKDKLIFLGDMIDRGPDSKGVLHTIQALQDAHPDNVIALRGNHEDMALDACVKQWHVELWFYNGGLDTMKSYGYENFDHAFMPDEDLRWLSKLPYFHEEPGFFFSHAPVPKEEYRTNSRGLPFTTHELTWTYDYVEDEIARDFKEDDGKNVIGVCGHIHALRRNNPTPRIYPHYIFLDAGCGCSDDAPLFAIEVTTMEQTAAWPAELEA